MDPRLTMRAEILPLQGKYYGTRVRIFDEEQGIDGEVDVWFMGDGKPSERELEGYELRDGKWMAFGHYGWDTEPSWYEYEICDSHYETQQGYEIAQKLVRAINSE